MLTVICAITTLILWQEKVTPSSGVTAERIILTSVAALSLLSNVAQFLHGRREQTHTTDNRTIASLKNTLAAVERELADQKTVAEKLTTDLDAVTEEYKTIVGLDIKMALDFAREGQQQEMARQKKRGDALERRLSKYEEV